MGPPGEEGLRGKACDAGQADARYSHRRLGDRGSFEASGRVDGVAEERGPVALRPRLSPGVPLSRESVTELRGGTTAVNYRHSGATLP